MLKELTKETFENSEKRYKSNKTVPVMAAVAVRKKVVSIGHLLAFTKILCLVTANFFSIRSNKEQLYELIALKIREK